MGADGNVVFWDRDAVEAKHHELHGRELADDWWYLKRGNCSVTLAGKRWIVAYYEAGGGNEGTYPMHEESAAWFGATDNDHELARSRVAASLEAVGQAAETEVWT